LIRDEAGGVAGIARCEPPRHCVLLAGSGAPYGRIGQPEDIARVVAMLYSEDAAYMTGQAKAVNGGAIMVP